MRFIDDNNNIIYVKNDSYENFYVRLYKTSTNNIKYHNGYVIHREDGPAIEHFTGDKSWYINGKRHREDGPAIEYITGGKIYFLNDIHYSEKEYWRIINIKNKKQILDCVLNNE